MCIDSYHCLVSQLTIGQMKELNEELEEEKAARAAAESKVNEVYIISVILT